MRGAIAIGDMLSMRRSPKQDGIATAQAFGHYDSAGMLGPVRPTDGTAHGHTSGRAATLPTVPTISRFYGIAIRMYFADHAPAHFHAHYGEYEAVVLIQTLEIARGELPGRALRLVREWAEIHRDELEANWKRIQEPGQPLRIDPLP